MRIMTSFSRARCAGARRQRVDHKLALLVPRQGEPVLRNGLLPGRRLADAHLEKRRPLGREHGALLHRRNGPSHRIPSPAALCSPRHKARLVFENR